MRSLLMKAGLVLILVLLVVMLLAPVMIDFDPEPMSVIVSPTPGARP